MGIESHVYCTYTAHCMCVMYCLACGITTTLRSVRGHMTCPPCPQAKGHCFASHAWRCRGGTTAVPIVPGQAPHPLKTTRTHWQTLTRHAAPQPYSTRVLHWSILIHDWGEMCSEWNNRTRMHEVYIHTNAELTTRTAWKRSWHRHSLSYSQWLECGTCPPLASFGLLLLAAPVVPTPLHQEPLRQGVREERQSASNTHGSPPPGIDQAEGDSNDARHVCCCVIPTATSLVCVRTNGRCRGMTEPTSFPSFSGCKCTVQNTEKHVLVLKGINIILAGKISTHSVRVTPVRRVCASRCAGDMLAVLLWH